MSIEWVTEHWLAVLLLVVYTALLFYNAYVGKRASEGLADFYVGGRNMGGIAIGVSFFATFASTNSYIGNAGKSYAYGLSWMIMAFGLVVATWIAWRWVGPKLREFTRTWDALTLPDYLGSRFVGEEDRANHPLRVLSALIIVFCSLLYLIAIFKGAGHLFQQFLGVEYETAVVITLIIVVLYTSLGGFVSVVRTDVMQGGLMIVGSLVLFYFVTSAAGGPAVLTELAEVPEKAFLFELSGGIPIFVLLGIALSGSLKVVADPRQLSRFYALQDDAAAKQGLWVATIGLAVVCFCLFPIGLYAHLILPAVADTDLIVPTLVADTSVIPIWAGDFLVLAIVAAAMSSMDSVLLVISSTAYKNIVEPIRASATPLRWTRIAVVGFAVLAAILALRPPGDIVEITIFSGSLYAVCFAPAVVLGLNWHKGSALGVLLSISIGVFVLLLWMLAGMRGILHEVIPALAASLLTYSLVAVYSRSEDARE